MIKTVAILAGGLGTRLGSLTSQTPKAMIEVAGKPFIGHQLSLLKKQGITDVVLCLGYLGQRIEEYVDSGSRWGLNVKYSYDGSELLGTGRALLRALPLLPEAFFVTWGDSYLDIDFNIVSDCFETSKKLGLMTIYENAELVHKNNVLFKYDKILMHSKVINTFEMKHLDYGLNILTKDAFAGFSDKFSFDLSLVFSKLCEKNQLAALEVTKKFYEIGSMAGMSETEHYLDNKIENK